MTILFDDSVGSLFGILGRVGAVIANQEAVVALQETAMASPSTGIVGQLDNEPDVQAIVGSGYLSALASIGGSVGPLMQQVAEATVNRIVYRDNPRAGQTLTTFATLASLQEIIRQMKQQGATVLAQTITATPTPFGPNGNAELNYSVRRPLDGLVLENTFAETLNAYCTNDSYVGGATAGNEGITITGGGSEPDVFAFDWPLGSGCSAGLSCIDGSKDNSAGNVLTNSGWDNFTANIPNFWGVVVGVAGTNFQQNHGINYDGGSSLQLIGDGSTLVSLRQVFGDGTLGTAGTLNPLAQYSFCGWFIRDGIASTNGTLQISLKDGNGTIIQDANGVNNAFTVDLTALSTAWIPYKGAFRLPLVLPTTMYIVIEMIGTPLTAGRSVYLDRFSLGPMNQLYVSGPYVAAHSGSVPLQMNDYASTIVTNSRGAGGSLVTWGTLLFQLLPLIGQNELLFPSSAAPSVLDSWIA